MTRLVGGFGSVFGHRLAKWKLLRFIDRYLAQGKGKRRVPHIISSQSRVVFIQL